MQWQFRERPPGLLQHVLTVLVFWSWVLLLPQLPPWSRSLRLLLWASILLYGLWTFAWICCPQLPHHQCHFCGACRSAAVKFSPEIVYESCHGKCREISGEISLLLVPQETKLENAQNFSRQISRRFSRDVLQLQMPNFIAFFILQTFVLDQCKNGTHSTCFYSTGGHTPSNGGEAIGLCNNLLTIAKLCSEGHWGCSTKAPFHLPGGLHRGNGSGPHQTFNCRSGPGKPNQRKVGS